jgi:2-desacetyl-2-hydroxyethyl bacteriochlorophyllide A dehydrogenase
MSETTLVIRAYNEEAHLPALFDALERQTYRDFGVVVVDSGSVDRTREIALGRAQHVVRVRSEDFTFGYSLNVGIARGVGPYVAIVSAHTLPTDQRWLEHLVLPLADARTAMVYGRQIGREDSKFSERLDFDRTFGTQRRVLTPPGFFANNANAAIRRDLWEQHGFDEALPGLEDIAWAKYWMERDYKVYYEPTACIYHFHAETWEQVRHRYRREAIAARLMGLRDWRDVPREAWLQTNRFFADLAHAVREGRLGERGAEIARFRYEKLVGTISGFVDGRTMSSPAQRAMLFYDKPYAGVVIHGPGHASLDARAIPGMAPSEVLVRVAYVGICATDLEILDGTLGYYKSGMAKYPIVPGHEFSGTVAAVGARVNDVREGERVVVECIQGCGGCPACHRGNPIACQERREVGVIGRDGGYGEYMVTPARFLHRVPSGVTLKEACLCEPLAVVLKGLRRLECAWGSADPPRRCAVIGAGPIGHLAARLLASSGHSVTVFDRSPRRLEYFAGSMIQVDQELQHLNQFDGLVEATGDPDALHKILLHSGPGATILLLGLPYAQRDFSFEAIVGYDKTIVGSVGSAAEDFAVATETVGRIDTRPFLQSTFSLRSYQEAWAAARARTQLKVILRVDDSVD